MPLTEPLDLEPIKAREQAATWGPWEVGDLVCEPTALGMEVADSSEYEYMTTGAWLHHPVVQTAWIHGQAQSKVYVTGVGVSPYKTPNCVPHIYPYDAAFIAHARADVPALIAEVERLRAIHAELRGWCDHKLDLVARGAGQFPDPEWMVRQVDYMLRGTHVNKEQPT